VGRTLFKVQRDGPKLPKRKRPGLLELNKTICSMSLSHAPQMGSDR
jgi:hypothetical protein